jgi:hypothetical protein
MHRPCQIGNPGTRFCESHVSSDGYVSPVTKGQLRGARVFDRDVWKFYAGISLCRKILFQINEKEDGTLIIFCMRLAQTQVNRASKQRR